jgi:hypothetical protein
MVMRIARGEKTVFSVQFVLIWGKVPAPDGTSVMEPIASYKHLRCEDLRRKPGILETKGAASRRGFSRPFDMKKQSIPQTRRLWSRFPLGSKVRLAWNCEKPASMEAAGLDISEWGMCVSSGAAIPVGTHVAINIPGLQLAGSGFVRHCKRGWFRHRIGIAFQGTLCRSYQGMAIGLRESA